MKMQHTILAPLCLLAALGLANRAYADDYQRAVENALEEFRLNHWSEARALFSDAHALSPSARTLRGMGVCSFKLRDYVSAVREFDAALADERKPLDATQRKEVEETLALAQRFVARYQLSLSPQDAVIVLDGRPAALTQNHELLLNPGEHLLHVSHEGHEERSVTVRAESGDRAQLTIRLTKRGSLAEASKQARPASAAAGIPPTAEHVPANTPGGDYTWTWVLGGTTLAFGAASLTCALLGRTSFDEIEDACRDGRCSRAEIDARIADSSIPAYETLTNVALGLTLGAAVATVVSYIITGEEADESAAKVTPRASGADLVLRF